MRRVRAWVLYDADCAFCRDLMARVEVPLKAWGFYPEALQSAWVRRRLILAEEQLLAEMRVLTREGQVYGGADGLVYLASVVPWRDRPWWAWLLVIVSKMLFGILALRRGYRWVAARRSCRAGSCPVRKPPISTEEGIR